MTLFQCDRCKVITVLAGIRQGIAQGKDLCVACNDELTAWLAGGVPEKTASPDSVGTLSKTPVAPAPGGKQP